MELDIPTAIKDWVEQATGSVVVYATRPEAGASREAWAIDLESGEPHQLFLLKDKGDGKGSDKDAAVLKALELSAVPVPKVVATSSEAGLILLERVAGNSEFPTGDVEYNWTVALDLMAQTAALHAIEPGKLAIEHLEPPSDDADFVAEHLQLIESVLPAFGNDLDPFFPFALSWLRRNDPGKPQRSTLVHSDMGPGNFLHAEGRISAIVDWEVAHFGDPMEDLGTIAVRDVATPVGDLKALYTEYEKLAGCKIELQRIAYYRTLIFTRNSLMISLGLKFPPQGFDFLEMLMYQALLKRSAALSICDCLGLAYPVIPLPEDTGADHPLVAGAGSALREHVSPALEIGFAVRQAAAISKALDSVQLEYRLAETLNQLERGALEKLGEELGESLNSGRELVGWLQANTQAITDNESTLAVYFADDLCLQALRRRPLLDELYERVPQRLLA